MTEKTLPWRSQSRLHVMTSLVSVSSYSPVHNFSSLNAIFCGLILDIAMLFHFTGMLST